MLSGCDALMQLQMDEYEMYDSEFEAVDVEYRDGTGIGSTLLPSPASDAGYSRDALMMFGVWYQGVHGYVCIVICLFGIVSNAMNIAVLTRRSMVIDVCFLLTYYSLVTTNLACLA